VVCIEGRTRAASACCLLSCPLVLSLYFYFSVGVVTRSVLLLSSTEDSFSASEVSWYIENAKVQRVITVFFCALTPLVGRQKQRLANY